MQFNLLSAFLSCRQISPYQRKGIGKNLIASLSEYCKERGYREIFVQADLADQHALDFYQATGGKEEKVIHYVYSLV